MMPRIRKGIMLTALLGLADHSGNALGDIRFLERGESELLETFRG